MHGRNNPLKRIGIFVGVVVVFMYGLYISHDLRTRLKTTEEERERYKRNQETLSAQLQVSIEHKNRLEQSLNVEKLQRKKTQDDLVSQNKEVESRLSREKQELVNNHNSLNQQHRMLKSQHADLQEELGKSQRELETCREDSRKTSDNHNSEFMQFKQEKENEIAQLRDTIANCNREKEKEAKQQQQSQATVAQLSSQLQLLQAQQQNEKQQSQQTITQLNTALLTHQTQQQNEKQQSQKTINQLNSLLVAQQSQHQLDLQTISSLKTQLQIKQATKLQDEQTIIQLHNQVGLQQAQLEQQKQQLQNQPQQQVGAGNQISNNQVPGQPQQDNNAGQPVGQGVQQNIAQAGDQQEIVKQNAVQNLGLQSILRKAGQNIDQQPVQPNAAVGGGQQGQGVNVVQQNQVQNQINAGNNNGQNLVFEKNNGVNAGDQKVVDAAQQVGIVPKPLGNDVAQNQDFDQHQVKKPLDINIQVPQDNNAAGQNNNPGEEGGNIQRQQVNAPPKREETQQGDAPLKQEGAKDADAKEVDDTNEGHNVNGREQVAPPHNDEDDDNRYAVDKDEDGEENLEKFKRNVPDAPEPQQIDNGGLAAPNPLDHNNAQFEAVQNNDEQNVVQKPLPRLDELQGSDRNGQGNNDAGNDGAIDHLARQINQDQLEPNKVDLGNELNENEQPGRIPMPQHAVQQNQGFEGAEEDYPKAPVGLQQLKIPVEHENKQVQPPLPAERRQGGDEVEEKDYNYEDGPEEEEDEKDEYEDGN